MAITSRGRPDLRIPTKCNSLSPERTKIWTESVKSKTERKVSVVYYLSRNGCLEHPHFIEVPLASNEGLYLRDVINRLNVLRGKGMATMYSWSSKRNFKNGFVWQDLSENDFIYPSNGQEYVLKGSELLERSTSFRSNETSSPSSENTSEPSKMAEICGSQNVRRRRNQSLSAVDFNEYKVYKPESAGDSIGKAADAATQTDNKRHERKIFKEEEENHTTELNKGDISPPPSSPSPESVIKSEDHQVNGLKPIKETESQDQADKNAQGEKSKTSTVLIQLISCGALTVSDDKPTATSKKNQRASLIPQWRTRLPRVAWNHHHHHQKVVLEDKEYFSGSLLIETKKKEEFSGLKRSCSYNADRRSKLVEGATAMDRVRGKSMREKVKTVTEEAGDQV